jgi:hypothetical protein
LAPLTRTIKSAGQNEADFESSRDELSAEGEPRDAHVLGNESLVDDGFTETNVWDAVI